MKILIYLVSEENIELLLDIAEGKCSRVCVYPAEGNREVKGLHTLILLTAERQKSTVSLAIKMRISSNITSHC